MPVIFLTARDSVEDRIGGLTAGGDDYVTKPFSLEEVIARLRALLRRSGAALARADSFLVVGDLTLDEDSHEVHRGGTEIQLTATEFELLRYLMRNPRRVLSKAQILDRVWNYDFGGQANVVELYISYLRKKIDANCPPMIHTARRWLCAAPSCYMSYPAPVQPGPARWVGRRGASATCRGRILRSPHVAAPACHPGDGACRARRPVDHHCNGLGHPPSADVAARPPTRRGHGPGTRSGRHLARPRPR